MSDIGLEVIYWLIVFTGSLAVTASLLWASFQLLTFILKSLGLWKDTIKIMYIYYSMKRNDKSFKYKGRLYNREEEK